MLKQYKSIIYQNEREEQETINECIDTVCRQNSSFTKDEVINAVNNRIKANPLYDDFCLELALTEGAILFNKAVEKFGNKLWSNKHLPRATCNRKCPVATVCEKKSVIINGERFCYGQLYLQGINTDALLQIAKEKTVHLVDAQENIILNLNVPDCDEQRVAEYFFAYEMCAAFFGDYNIGKKVNGKNVIKCLSL